jgi:enoyl-CoA hydratase/carnithine racemase
MQACLSFGDLIRERGAKRMSCLLISRADDGVVELTMHRPHKANAMNGELVEALIAAVGECHTAPPRLLVIRGAGDNFCGGFDFSGIESESEGDLVLRFIRIELLLQAVSHAPFPTLALAHGRTFGAGADLVCACAERIAASGAVFSFPGPRFGVALGTGRLALRIGAARARSILFQSRAIDTAVGVEIGLISAVAERDEWPALIKDRVVSASRLSRHTTRLLLDITASDTRAADMAALVESISQPGLKDRMIGYFEAVKRSSSAKRGS